MQKKPCEKSVRYLSIPLFLLKIFRIKLAELVIPVYVISDERETTLLNADSPEFWCQNSLLKLQSLLCSTTLCSSAAPLEEGNSGSPHNIVKSFLDIKPDTVGALSLRYHISPK